MNAFGANPSVSATGRALEPAWVREGSPEVQHEYALGQAFEQQLISELTRQIVPSEEGGGEGEASGDPTQSLVSSMVPEALAGAVATGRGLGIAEQLTRELSGRAAAAGPAATASPAATVTPAGGSKA